MTSEPEPLGVSGKPLVLFFAAVILVAAVIVVAYKLQERGLPPQSMAFERLPEAPAGVNATVLPYKQVHAANFLEDHLNTAIGAGTSAESDLLRIDSMRQTLLQVMASAGPVWVVDWDGHVVRITWTGPPAPMSA